MPTDMATYRFNTSCCSAVLMCPKVVQSHKCLLHELEKTGKACKGSVLQAGRSHVGQLGALSAAGKVAMFGYAAVPRQPVSSSLDEPAEVRYG